MLVRVNFMYSSWTPHTKYEFHVTLSINYIIETSTLIHTSSVSSSCGYMDLLCEDSPKKSPLSHHNLPPKL